MNKNTSTPAKPIIKNRRAHPFPSEEPRHDSLNGMYLCGFVFHTGSVRSMRVPRPLACEVRPCDGIQGRCPPDGTGTPTLQLGPFGWGEKKKETGWGSHTHTQRETQSCRHQCFVSNTPRHPEASSTLCANFPGCVTKIIYSAKMSLCNKSLSANEQLIIS